MNLLRAAWVAPMDGPLIRDGAVVIEGGRIVAVGEGARLAQSYPAAEVEHLGNAVLLPGLINAHTHLELSLASCGEKPGGSFADWILSIRQRTQLGAENLQATVAAAVARGVEQ